MYARSVILHGSRLLALCFVWVWEAGSPVSEQRRRPACFTPSPLVRACFGWPVSHSNTVTERASASSYKCRRGWPEWWRVKPWVTKNSWQDWVWSQEESQWHGPCLQESEWLSCGRAILLAWCGSGRTEPGEVSGSLRKKINTENLSQYQEESPINWYY